MDALSSPHLWLKYLFRFLHIAPVIVVGGKIFNDYILNTPKADLTRDQQNFHMIAGIVLMIAGKIFLILGFVNTFLLKPKETMKQQAKFWIGFHHLKLLLSIVILTPLIGLLAQPSTVNTIRFSFVLILLIVSPFMRYYREYHTEKNRKQAK
jgi:hypothetical protein